MAYIKSLICEGFKSFKTRTKVNFSEGFTSIVGANGSGKSNILDAFVFALGNLSGSKMRVNNIKDLICNGGKNGTPSKWARVDVVFDNKDRKIPVPTDEVTVSRKINIDGKGKYYINDKRSTRRDIQDILDIAGLLPNSSNLILQGELFRIINMNDNERRGLIEDISGIASYNEKREKAEKDLEKVEENISRITLLLNELSVQLESLEQERDDALKYQEFDKQQKDAEEALLITKIQTLEREIEKIKSKKESLQAQIQNINDTIIDKRSTLQKITTQIDAVNEELKTLQSDELKRLTQELNTLKTESTKKETQSETLENDIERLEKSVVSLFGKKDDLEETKHKLESSLSEKTEKKDEVKKSLTNLKEELYHCEEQIKDFDSEHLELQKSLDNVKKAIAEKKEIKSTHHSEIRVMNNKHDNITQQIEKLTSKTAKLKEEITVISRKIENIKRKESQLSQDKSKKIDFNQLEREKKELNKTLKTVRAQIDDKHDRLISLKSKVKAMKKFTTNRAVEAILQLKTSPEMKEQYNIRGNIYGTIAQLGKADEKYNTALQVAGGSRFNYVVVDHQQTAKECIQYLKQTKTGRASFIPISAIRTYSRNFQLPNDPNVIGRAVDLIEFDPLFTKAFEYVFGTTIVVSDLDAATSLDTNARRVTLEGDIIDSSNLMTGGNAKKYKKGGFGSKEESKIPLLEMELSKLRKQEDDLASKLKEIEHTITSNYKLKISSNNEINELKQKIAVLENQCEQKAQEIKDLEASLKELEGRRSEILGRIVSEKKKMDDILSLISELQEEESSIQKKISLLSNNDFTKKIKHLRQEIDKLEKVKMKLDLEITKINTQIEEISQNREKEIIQQIQETQDAIKEKIQTLVHLKEALTQMESDIRSMEKEVLEKNQIIGEIYTKKEDLLTQQTEIKVEIEDLKSSIHPKNLKINTLDINLNNNERQKMELKEKCEISDAKLENLKELMEKSSSQLSVMIQECLNNKLKLEPVNMRAIKKYDKIKNRYDDLIDKHEVVVEERLAILDFIEKIEAEKKRTFLETFNGINKNFKEIFGKLSPGGEAKLVIQNEEDPFAGGVEMLARPGGKKWCLTQSMSGGEKTLTVVALVLGIQMYVPSPYYILDEIDAAFDDHNASQVACMIKELSNDSQFILITHRDVTMTQTDQLLGVSNVHGITSVLNLNIQEALETIAES